MTRSPVIVSCGTALLTLLAWLAASIASYNGQASLRAIGEITISEAATGGVVVAVWCWLLRKRLGSDIAASFIRGLLCGVVLIVVFEISSQVRRIVAPSLFPYVISLRFGLPGAVLISAILDTVLVGALVYVLAARGNLTTRWSGP